MKEAQAEITKLSCSWCGLALEEKMGIPRHCDCCDNDFCAGDDIICCYNELPISEDNFISLESTLHYCSMECYSEDAERREEYLKDLEK